MKNNQSLVFIANVPGLKTINNANIKMEERFASGNVFTCLLVIRWKMWIVKNRATNAVMYTSIKGQILVIQTNIARVIETTHEM